MKFLEKLFSIKNTYENGIKRKVITILGVKVRIGETRNSPEICKNPSPKTPENYITLAMPNREGKH